jgi:8-oxo-dGTP diphosphatase
MAKRTPKPKPYSYEYPRPAVTVDMVVFTLDADTLRVLMIRRKSEPFAGDWALPGGFLGIDEPIEDAALRELKEETGLEEVAMVSPIGVFGEPDRDPRGRTISLAHAGVVRGPAPEVAGGDDAARAAWLDPMEVEEFAFDHAEILGTALDWLMLGVEFGPAGLGLLPSQFGDSDVKRLFRALGLPAREATDWRKRLESEGQIERVRGAKGKYEAVEAELDEWFDELEE